MNAEDALLAIQEVMDGVEWNSDTCEVIANIMVQAGYRIRDLDDRDLYPELQSTAYPNRREINIQPLTDALTAVKSGIVRNLAEARNIPVVDIGMQKAVYETITGLPMEIIENADDDAFNKLLDPTLADHAAIWLEPMSPTGEYGSEGRTWAQDNPFDETNGPATKYIRSDLVAEMELTRVLARKQSRKLIELLKSIISDARGMQPHYNPDNHYFGPFSESIETVDGPNVEWPNLAISIGEAETYLKELECPASSSS